MDYAYSLLIMREKCKFGSARDRFENGSDSDGQHSQQFKLLKNNRNVTAPSCQESRRRLPVLRFYSFFSWRQKLAICTLSDVLQTFSTCIVNCEQHLRTTVACKSALRQSQWRHPSNNMRQLQTGLLTFVWRSQLANNWRSIVRRPTFDKWELILAVFSFENIACN